MYKIHMLPATFGDSILVEYGSHNKPYYILIDGGPYYNFGELWDAINYVSTEIKEIELLVVTHIDIDHIDGVIKLLNQTNLPFNIKEIWFNGKDQLEAAAKHEKKNDILGPFQGEYLTRLIKEKNISHNVGFRGSIACVYDYDNLPEKDINGMKIKLLSPGVKNLVNLIPEWDSELKGQSIEEKWEKDHRYADILGDDVEAMQDLDFGEDITEPNCSSIAFIATYEGKNCLFAADAPSHILLAGIDPMLQKSGEDRLKIDAWKLAHHGSKKSSQDSIMRKINCKKMLISSDGKRYKHPDKPVIAKLLKHNGPDLQLYFNYRTEFNEMWDDAGYKNAYAYTTFYPKKEARPGMTVEL